MGIPVLNGRDFSVQDLQPGAGKVIVNQAMANHYWPGRNPSGQHFKDHKQIMEIVGVVKTGKYRTLSEEPLDFMYLPLGSQSQEFLLVNTQTGEEAALGGIRKIIQSLDPNVVPIEMESISQYMTLPLFAAHTTGVLLGVFGAVALLLATIGLSGVVSYSVSQRTNEIGVRMALGADAAGVQRRVVGGALKLTLVGFGIGLAAAFSVTRFMTGAIQGVSFTGSRQTILLPLLPLPSSWVPWRSSRVTCPRAAPRRSIR